MVYGWMNEQAAKEYPCCMERINFTANTISQQYMPGELH